ncbi:hypothetical protein LBMAG20_18820 [Methylocystaceae bacterium]|nr:hypothetical protein LBMAG20_18820 [Methylocystaceae bacterium]
MDNFFKILSSILAVFLVVFVSIYFNNDIIAWLYQPTNNLSLIAVIITVAALALILIIKKLNNIYDLIIYINYEQGDDYEE